MIKKVFIGFLMIFALVGCSSNDSVSEQEMESILNDAYDDHVSNLD
jgi:uncharacterized protein YcfL